MEEGGGERHSPLLTAAETIRDIRTQKCRFMDKEVREISRFFLRHDARFPSPSGAALRTSLSTNTSTLNLILIY